MDLCRNARTTSKGSGHRGHPRMLASRRGNRLFLRACCKGQRLRLSSAQGLCERERLFGDHSPKSGPKPICAQAFTCLRRRSRRTRDGDALGALPANNSGPHYGSLRSDRHPSRASRACLQSAGPSDSSRRGDRGIRHRTKVSPVEAFTGCSRRDREAVRRFRLTEKGTAAATP